jgi:hypothetical protein
MLNRLGNFLLRRSFLEQENALLQKKCEMLESQNNDNVGECSFDVSADVICIRREFDNDTLSKATSITHLIDGRIYTTLLLTSDSRHRELVAEFDMFKARKLNTLYLPLSTGVQHGIP